MTMATTEHKILCPYRILGVHKQSKKPEILEAYRQQALLHHPRRLGSNTENYVKKNNTNYDRNNIHRRNTNLTPRKKKQVSPNHQNVKELFTNIKSTLNTHSVQEIDEEQEKEWKFIILSAAFETMYDENFRKRYDSLALQRNSIGYENVIYDDNLVPSHWDKLPDKNGSESPPTMSSSFSTKMLFCDDNNFTVCSATSKLSPRSSKKKSLTFDDDDTMLDDRTVSTVLSNSTLDKNLYDILRRRHESSPYIEENPFGGPLHLMYKARNHVPFTDPYRLFNQLFYSDIFHTNIELKESTSSIISYGDDGDSLTGWRQQLFYDDQQESPSTSPLLTRNRSLNHKNSGVACRSISYDTENSLMLPNTTQSPYKKIDSQTFTINKNGERITKTSRVMLGYQIIKTEIIKINPKTGRKEKTTSVEKHEIGDKPINIREDEEELAKSESGEYQENACCNSGVCCPKANQNTSTESEQRNSISSSHRNPLMELANILCPNPEESSSETDSDKKRNKKNEKVEEELSPAELVKRILQSCGTFVP